MGRAITSVFWSRGRNQGLMLTPWGAHKGFKAKLAF